MAITYGPASMKLEYIQRGKCWFLRMTTPHKQGGVHIYVQRSLCYCWWSVLADVPKSTLLDYLAGDGYIG